MKILIASDLHGSVAAFQKVLENEPDSEMVLLLGDYLYHGPATRYLKVTIQEPWRI